VCDLWGTGTIGLRARSRTFHILYVWYDDDDDDNRLFTSLNENHALTSHFEGRQKERTGQKTEKTPHKVVETSEASTTNYIYKNSGAVRAGNYVWHLLGIIML
jgi:hypothetical protein